MSVEGDFSELLVFDGSEESPNFTSPPSLLTYLSRSLLFAWGSTS